MEYRLTTPCTAQDLAPLKAGDTVLLSGVVYTARGQSGHIVRQGDIVLCSDAGAVTVCIQTVAVGEILVVKAVHRAVLRDGRSGRSRTGRSGRRRCGRSTLLFGQREDGKDHAQGGGCRTQHAEQGFG